MKRALATALFASATTGCTAAEYLAQAGCGQIDIMTRARSLSSVQKDERVPARVRELLGEVAAIKRFGEKNHLKPTESYHRYVELDRSVVVWVVTAASPLRFHSKTWWFPIVGRVPYLGWFKSEDAHAFADGLRAQGWDVDVGGAEAYSTLGWFDDPILSTMLPDDDGALGELVDVILHESLHATLYIDEQTPLNESLANFVAHAFTIKYLGETYGEGSDEQKAYLDGERRSHERGEKMHAAYEKLEALYASKKPKEEKLAEKARILRALGYDIKSSRPLNNATLASFKNYNSGKAELRALLEACGGDWNRLFASIGTLKKKGSFAKPNEPDLKKVLTPLVAGRCAAPR